MPGGETSEVELRVRELERLLNHVLGRLASIQAQLDKASQDGGRGGGNAGTNNDGWYLFQATADVPAASGGTIGNGGSIRILVEIGGVRYNMLDNAGAHVDVASPWNIIASVVKAKTYGAGRVIAGNFTIVMADCNPASAYATDQPLS